jgi:Mg/Co/Ni transporter MgtE
MPSRKSVRDIMVGIFEYPHVPYWVTIDQTIRIIKVSFVSTKTFPYPLVVLVFDEKYNLLGTLTLKDVLKGLEPRFMRTPPEKAQVLAEEETELSLIWDSLFNREAKELSKKQVSEIMVPVNYFVGPDDPITKAAYLMIHHDLILLPVLEQKKKFVGLVRMAETFDEITDTILEE